ncbi:hypothetical protein BDW68DRAFT_192235 [Aspergillus falconensis]
MVDPLSAAGLAYPIAKDLFKLAKKLRQAYHEIRHAKQSLKKMITRAETVAETYELFSDTMADAKKTKGLASTFKKHRKLMKRVESESTRIIKKIRIITTIFSPLLRNDPSDPVQRWIAQFQWYRKEKKVVVPLLMEMQILEGSMGLIARLVIIQMLQHSERRAISGRDSIQAEIQHLRKSMGIELKKLQDNRRVQEETFKQRSVTAKQDDSPIRFAQEILRIVEKEIPKLNHKQSPDSPSTPDSGPSSSSSAPRERAPSTAPSSPPRPNARGQESVVPSQIQEVAVQDPEGPCEVCQQQHRSHHHPLSASLSPPLSHLPSVAGDRSEQGESMEEDSPQHGPYVQMPPFGPPEARPRPRPGRSSPADLSPSGSRGDQRAKSRNPHYSDSFSGQRDRRSYSGSKRRTGSRISVYGDDGEVTHTHLTGSTGLPPGWQRRKEEP